MKSSKHQKILNTISFIRESHSEMVNIFSRGSCLNFFCILHSIYPEATPYFNISHIITKIGNKYYDITGEVKNVEKQNYQLYTEWYIKKKMYKSFRRMYKAEYKING